MKRFIFLLIGFALLVLVSGVYFQYTHERQYREEIARITAQLSQESGVVLSTIQQNKTPDLLQLYTLQQQTHELQPPYKYQQFHTDFSHGLDKFVLSVQYLNLNQPALAHQYAIQANTLLDKALQEMPK
jgi:type VI protein secretion system component VasK